MVITPDEYDSQDEAEPMQTDGETIYPDERDMLMLQRVLSAQQEPDEPEQRDNLFHSRCTIKDKVCHLIVDSGSCTNIASVTLIQKLGFNTTTHPKPYKLKWLNDKEEIKVSNKWKGHFRLGSTKTKSCVMLYLCKLGTFCWGDHGNMIVEFSTMVVQTSTLFALTTVSLL